MCCIFAIFIKFFLQVNKENDKGIFYFFGSLHVLYFSNFYQFFLQVNKENDKGLKENRAATLPTPEGPKHTKNGFERNLTAVSIEGATDETGQLSLLVRFKVKGLA